MAPISYGWWVIFACFLIAFYSGGGCFFGLTAFFEPIVEEFGWSHTLVSIAFSLRGFEMGIIAPITGFLVDRLGPRKVTFSGVLISGFALILLGLTNSLGMFYGAFVLLALGTSGCSSTALMTAVVHWFKENLGKAMGIVACGFGAGGVLIPLIVWLIEVYQWRCAFIVLGIGMWTLGIPLSFVIRPGPEQYGRMPDGQGAIGPNSIHEGRDGGDEVRFGDALRSKVFWMIGIAEALRMMISMAVVTHVMPYLSSVGMSRANAAFVATSIPLFSIIGRLGFGLLGDLIESKHALALAYCFVGFGILAFSHIHMKWLTLPFLLLFCPGLGGSVPLRGTMIREYFGKASFGRLFGILMGVTAIGGVAGPSVAGWTFDTLRTYQPIWLFFAGIAAISVALILRVEAPQRTGDGSKQEPSATHISR